MANIRVTCPACKTELEIDAAFEGQEVECGNCLEVFKAKPPGSAGSSGTGKIPGAGKGSSAGSGRSRPAPKKSRRDDDDDEYEHDRRRRDDDDDEDYAPPAARHGGSGPGDGAAVASLVLGVLAFPFACCAAACWPVSLLTGIGAIVTGVVGLKSQNYKGMAVAGLTLGLVALGISGVLILAGGNVGFNRFN